MNEAKPLTYERLKALIDELAEREKKSGSNYIYILNTYYWEKYKSWGKANKSDLVTKKGKK